MRGNFLLWASGTSRELLARCPETEFKRQVMIGAFVCLTAVFAFCTSAYALYSVSEDLYLSLLGGILWAVNIFNLDRFLVSTTSLKNINGEYKLNARSFIPRVVLAAMIGALIAIPSELYLFREEINFHIGKLLQNEQEKIEAKYQGDKLKEAKDRYQSDFQALQDFKLAGCTAVREDLKQIQEEGQRLKEMHTLEAKGFISGKVGNGPEYRSIDNRLSRNINDYNNRFRELTACLEQEKQEKNRLIANREAVHKEELKQTHEMLAAEQRSVEQTYPRQTLLTRYKALGQLKEEDSTVWRLSLFLTCFFVFLEVTPILAKLLTKNSVYDLRTHYEKIEEEVQIKEKEAQLMSRSAKVKRIVEQTQIDNEWATFQAAHQSFLDQFRQHEEEQIKKALEEWKTKLTSDTQPGQRDTNFGENSKQRLRFKEISQPSQARKNVDSLLKTIESSMMKMLEKAIGTLVHSDPLSTVAVSGIMLCITPWLQKDAAFCIPPILFTLALLRKWQSQSEIAQNVSQLREAA